MEPDPAPEKALQRFATSQADAERWLAQTNLIGLTEAEARALAASANIGLRVIARDGAGLALTADRRAARVNVELRDGRVSRVDGNY